jgi:hypothetical protein
MLTTIENVIRNALEISTLLLKIPQNNAKVLALLDTLILKLNNVLLFVLLDIMGIIKYVILTVLMFLQQYLLTMTLIFVFKIVQMELLLIIPH